MFSRTTLIGRLGSRLSVRVMQGDKNTRPFTVFVEGNIGSGKTTFLNNFKDDNSFVLSEPVNMWRDMEGHNLLSMMYEDPSRWGLLFQTYVQLTMLNLHLLKSEQPIKLQERSIHSARYCFVENLHRSKIITDAEFIVLDQWYKWITGQFNLKGDLIVYLRTSPEVIYERIRARAREEENCVSLDYLKTLHELHEKWLLNDAALISTPVVVIDADKDLNSLEKDSFDVKSRIIHQSLNV